ADSAVAALHHALASGQSTVLRDAVRALVGLGTGSTPGGDDVLCGTMAGLRATGRDVLADQIAIASLDGVDDRTPALSADLLRLAAHGHVCTAAGAVLRALDSGQAQPPQPAATGHSTNGSSTGTHNAADSRADSHLTAAPARLLQIGHTSGADL